MTNIRLRQMLCSVSCLTLAGWAAPTYAQAAGDRPAAETDAGVTGEILVTARRRDEALQDVPLVVNVVTPKTLADLQIRQFTDIAQVVPGLTLTRNALTASATLRGVNFNTFASANNNTVESYLNDTPVSAVTLFQSLFDVGQIEVLRGPQGTLRGRAAPSGSITVTTHKPSFEGIGATASLTGSLIDSYNAQGALNLPVVSDVLAVRVAGMYDELGKRTPSVNASTKPYERSWGGRASVLFTPTSTLTFNGMFQRLKRHTRSFPQVESANLVDPTQPASPVPIGPFDRLGVANDANYAPQEYTSWTWGAEWRVAGQKLNYVGGIHRSQYGPIPATGGDAGNFFNAQFPQPQLAAYGTLQTSTQRQEGHEIRLSSDDRLFGFLDYVVGAFQLKNVAPTNQAIMTPVFLGPIAAADATTPVTLSTTTIFVLSQSKERSVFGSVTAHLGEQTEITGGLRRISYHNQQNLAINGAINPSSNLDLRFHATIFSGSLKHRFNDDLMAYVSVGSSWRPGNRIIGDFSIAQSALEKKFTFLEPEKSKSYELGVKATLFDKRLRLNATVYHQTFQNYPYRPAAFVSFVSTSTVLGQSVESVLTGPGGFNFVAPVPAKVDGVEVEASFQATSRWSIGGNLSYTNGRFKDAIPCNDYNPHDGVPDALVIIPTIAQVRAASGGDNLTTCDVKQSTSQAPRWTATAQSEYHFPIKSKFEGYLRGFATYYGNSLNDPTNAVDDVPHYLLANAFVGVREPDGAWDVSLFVRNLTDVKRVLNRSPGILNTSYATQTGGKVGRTTYRSVSVSDPREFGISLRVAFGSR